MPKASRLGGHFERLIKVTEQVLYKSLETKSLNWSELEEVLQDVEINLINRPCIQKDIQHSILTPKSMILGRDTKMVDKNMIKIRKKILVGKNEKH